MIKNNTLEMLRRVDEYLEPIIEEYAADNGDDLEGRNPYAYLIERARECCAPVFADRGDMAGIAYFLGGCGLPGLTVRNHEILELVESWRGAPIRGREARDGVCVQWFKFLAAKVLKLAEKQQKGGMK
jgi:hypothetical protein